MSNGEYTHAFKLGFFSITDCFVTMYLGTSTF